MKYRLLKDLPNYSADTVFDLRGNNEVHDTYGQRILSEDADFIHAHIENVDFFKPIQEPKHWRAQLGQDYYVLGGVTYLLATPRTEQHVHDNDRDHIAGNYFKTREQAEKAAEAIKAVLEYMHNADLEIAFSDNEEYAWPIVSACEAARKAIQETAL